MSSLLVPIAIIENILPHSNADALELAQVLGWQLVVKKGDYQIGDKVVYFPIDTLLPLELSERFGVTRFLSKQRIRCARLRGEPSFGLAVQPDNPDWPVGENVADYYRVSKYEPPLRPTAGDAERDHPLFPSYTEIENMRNFPAVFEEGEIVVLTEKVHGCLSYTTKISMADGSRKRIIDVQKGDYVLGVDENGKIVPSLVLNTFNNGKAEKWITVTGKRKKAGGGNSTWNVHCTPNHRFWNPQKREYVSAENLVPGDKTLLVRKEIELTPIQEQILIGKMLGDGYLHTTSYDAAGVNFTQKVEDREYVMWTLQGLGDIACSSLGAATSGYGTQMIRANTTFNSAIFSRFKDWKRKGESKQIPEWVADKLSPISMAFWYMDDGSLSHQEDQEDRAAIAVCAFTEEECRILQRGLARFGIEAQYYQSGNNHSRFRLNADDAEKFFLLIAPYIPPCMQYKLPERYRGHAGWIPSSKNVYKEKLVEQTIESVSENKKIESSRWDLETETHNFFANYILVHNSNVRVGVVEGELMAGSKAVRRKRPAEDRFAGNVYWYPLALEPVRALVEQLAASHRQVVLFGEVYGSKIQSFHYGLKNKLGFRAFDLLVDGHYMGWDEFASLSAHYGVETVPVIARLPYDLAEIRRLSEGKTTLMEEESAHIREGLVVRPLSERTDPKIGRVILKYVSDSYLFGEKTDYTDK